MGLVDRLDRFQQRHPVVAFPLAVLYKFVDDTGGYLAALITYYGFVSLFPLLLLVSTVLGFVLSGDQHLQHQLLTSALKRFPVVGDQLNDPKRFGGGATGLVIGLIGSLYGGLGVAQAGQYALNTIWAVPRNSRPNPFKARGRSVLLLGTAGVGFVGTTVLSAVGSTGAGSAGVISRSLALAASVALSAAMFVLAFRIATARPLRTRDVLPGAIIAAVVWQLLQSFGAYYVLHVIRDATPINGVFALVLGLIAFLYLASLTVVLASEVNVVRANRLYPRALLTPFTDEVRLTAGDQRTYTRQAKTQRMKGFQRVDVTFTEQPPVADDSGKPAPNGDPDGSFRSEGGR